MTLLATEFLRRFFLHVLPKGSFDPSFWVSHEPASCKRLALCRILLSVRSPVPRHANHPQHRVPVALPTMRHGDDHHP